MHTSALLHRSITAMAFLAMAIAGLQPAAARVSAAPPQSRSNRALSDLKIEEFQPDVPNGGRANTIALEPKKEDTILVASESGGLFKTTDGGIQWKHIDGPLPFFTNSVTFLTKFPAVAIVTTSEDFSAANQGGIWRSDNEGDTWAPVVWSSGSGGVFAPPGTQPKQPSPSPDGLAKLYSAFEISVAPDTGTIFVASTAGVEVGSADGTTWTHRSPGAAALPIKAVLALPEETPGNGNIVLAGGPAGVWRSADGGKTWAQVSPGPGCTSLTREMWPAGCILDMHAFGRSPVAKNEAYVVNNDKEIYHMHSGPNKTLVWDLIGQTPAFDAWCGGIAFIQVKPTPSGPGVTAGSLDLYFGDRCQLYRLTAPPGASAGTYDYKKNTWQQLVLDHGDTRHIAFNSANVPLLLATDGGLHKTSNGGASWTFTGGGPAGYNALQIYQVKGQWIDNTGKNNLYFGTQDNWFWSSIDNAKTWVHAENEGDFFEALPHVPTDADSQITFWAKSKNWRLTTRSLADPLEAWNDPPEQAPGEENAAWVGRPKIVAKNFHVQWVEGRVIFTSSSGQPVPQVLRQKGLAVTYSLSKPTAADADGWQQYAVIDDPAHCGNCSRLDLPRVAYPPNGEPILYQALVKNAVSNLEYGALARLIPNPNGDDATTEYPAMTGFGGFGTVATMEGWLRVFAVEPTNANHLIAADVINQKVMDSWDAGESWQAMQALTNQVTNNGKLNFRGRMFFTTFPSGADFMPYTQVSAISFCPYNSELVALGTVQNGIFLSIDHGKTWKKIPGSERATLVSSLYWRTFDEIIVSTYGRGLWRAKFKITSGTKVCNLPDCLHVYYEQPPKQRPSPYDFVIAAYGGEIRGVRLLDGIVQEIFVRPGTSLEYEVGSLEAPDILVTETTASPRSLGAAVLPGAPAGSPVLTGLTLRTVGAESELVGLMFSPRPLAMFVPPAGPAVVRPSRPAPPTWSGPTLELLSGPEVAAGEPIQIKGGGLPAGTEVEIQLDGITVETVTAGADGSFEASVPAPGGAGFHSLTLLVGGKAVNGAILGIHPGD